MSLNGLSQSQDRNVELKPSSLKNPELFAPAQPKYVNTSSGEPIETAAMTPAQLKYLTETNKVSRVVAAVNPLSAPISDGYLIAGAGPVDARKFFPKTDSIRNEQEWLNGNGALRDREARTQDLQQQLAPRQDPGILDGSPGFQRVASVQAAVYNPINSKGLVETQMFIVALGRDTTLDIVRKNYDESREGKPNPAARNQTVAEMAKEFEAHAGDSGPFRIPKVLISGGLFNAYGDKANSEMLLVNDGVPLATGKVGPGQKVLFQNSNLGKGYSADEHTQLGVGAQPPSGGNYQQSYSEATSVMAGKTGFTTLHPSVDQRNERERQVLFGVDKEGHMFVLVTKKEVTQDTAVAFMRATGATKIGISDGGNSAALSVWNGSEYVNLVDTWRRVNSAIAISGGESTGKK